MVLSRPGIACNRGLWTWSSPDWHKAHGLLTSLSSKDIFAGRGFVSWLYLFSLYHKGNLRVLEF